VIVPIDQLDHDVLLAVITECVTRDGCEHTDADTKREQALRGLRSGTLVLTYDPDSGTTNIISADDATE